MRLRRKTSTSLQPEVTGTRRKRSWKTRLGEFVLWALVAIATAAIMISMSETLLPSNF